MLKYSKTIYGGQTKISGSWLVGSLQIKQKSLHLGKVSSKNHLNSPCYPIQHNIASTLFARSFTVLCCDCVQFVCMLILCIYFIFSGFKGRYVFFCVYPFCLLAMLVCSYIYQSIKLPVVLIFHPT